jgi:hypothetical protein
VTHRETGYAQIILSAVFIVGYFGVLYAFIEGRVRVPVDWRDAMITLLGVLTANVGTICSYWFSRQRQSAEATP